MVIKENIILNGKEFIKHYSNENFYIQKVGTQQIYSEAIDIPTANYEYVETDKKIEEQEDKEIENEK